MSGKLPRGYHRHDNGGGLVKDGLTVAASVYVGPEAVLRGGEFHDGTFYGGTFRGGMFHGGTFYGGMFHGGMFHDGTFHDGEFRGGWFYGGTFYGGWFYDGEFRGGTFYDGVFYGGEFHGGMFHDGEFRGGVHRESPLFIQGTRDYASYVGPFSTEDVSPTINIGCERRTIEHWVSHHAEIGAANKYTEAQVREYGTYIKMFAARYLGTGEQSNGSGNHARGGVVGDTNGLETGGANEGSNS